MPPRGVKKGPSAPASTSTSRTRSSSGVRRRTRREEIAARTVNKERARHGESREASRLSKEDISSGGAEACAPTGAAPAGGRETSCTRRRRVDGHQGQVVDEQGGARARGRAQGHVGRRLPIGPRGRPGHAIARRPRGMSGSAEPAAAPTLPRQSGPGPRPEVEETPKERTDRQLLELLNELRVALPGAVPVRVPPRGAVRGALRRGRARAPDRLLRLPALDARGDDPADGARRLPPHPLAAGQQDRGDPGRAPDVPRRDGGARRRDDDRGVVRQRLPASARAESLVAAIVSVVLLGLTWLALPLRERAARRRGRVSAAA